MASTAQAETVRNYYYAKMELHCAQVNHGAKWLGVGTGAIPVPIIGALIPALVTEECDQHTIRKAAYELRKFRKDHPAIAHKYERKYGGSDGISYTSSFVTTSGTSSCSGWPAGMLPSGC